MKQSLSAFQDAFVDALYSDAASPLAAIVQQPGFAVYRNTVMKGACDALLANFPSVERLVGREWFAAAAAVHARQSPPADARLLYYGADFPRFLDEFEHARDMPYLGNVARLDRLWIAAHGAPEHPGIDLAALAGLDQHALLSTRFSPHATAHWAWFAEQPAYSIWRHNREQLAMPEELPWVGEGALLSRVGGQVIWQALSAGECVFLDACTAGLSLACSAEQALNEQPDLNMNELLPRLIKANALVMTACGE